MKIRYFVVLIMMMIFTGISQASSELTSVYLMEGCEKPDSHPDKLLCTAYMAGFTHGVFAGVTLQVPKNGVELSPLTLIKMFMKDMREHPEAGDTKVDDRLKYLLLKSGKFERA